MMSDSSLVVENRGLAVSADDEQPQLAVSLRAPCLVLGLGTIVFEAAINMAL